MLEGAGRGWWGKKRDSVIVLDRFTGRDRSVESNGSWFGIINTPLVSDKVHAGYFFCSRH